MPEHGTKRAIYPIVVVLTTLSLIEVSMTLLYPRLGERWERIPILALIVVIPASIITTFLYLWVRRPGHLYPPSEFGSGAAAELKLSAYSCNRPVPFKGLEKEFDRARKILASCAKEECALCILDVKAIPNFLYCQGSFSIIPGEAGVFKFVSEFDQLVNTLPALIVQRNLARIIVGERNIFQSLQNVPELTNSKSLFVLARD